MLKFGLLEPGLTNHQTPAAEAGEEWEEEDPELASAIAASLAASSSAGDATADRAPSGAAASPVLAHSGPGMPAPASGRQDSAATPHEHASSPSQQQPRSQSAAEAAEPTPPEPDAGPGEILSCMHYHQTNAGPELSRRL